MSDEPKKSDPLECRWQPEAVVRLDEEKPKWGTPEKIMAFFCVNLLAAYVPAVVCVMDLGPKVSSAFAYLISPFLLTGLMVDSTSAAARWFFLFFIAAFILLLFWASAALHNSRKAWVAIPSILFVSSLLQGMFIVSFLKGFGGG
jgi:hypothetical protein